MEESLSYIQLYSFFSAHSLKTQYPFVDNAIRPALHYPPVAQPELYRDVKSYPQFDY